MKTLGARLALWYALITTLTLIILLAAGYYLLSQHLLRGIDLQNESEYEHFFTDSFSLDDRTVSPGRFVEVIDGSGRSLYRSDSLGSMALPSAAGAHTVKSEALGVLRVGVFLPEGRTVKIATSLEPARQVMLGYAEISVVLVCLVLLISVVSGMILSQIALWPVRSIQETANRIRFDHLSERIPVGTVRDEISSLAQLLNEMFDRLETAFEQVRLFSADASHELKTPLSLIRLQAEKLLADGNLNPMQEEAVLEQLEEIARMSKIIEEMLFLSRAEAQAISPTLLRQDPRRFLEDVAADAALLAEQAGVSFQAEITEEGEVAFDAKWMRQALLNLISNAIHFSPPGGLVTLESRFSIEKWILAVEDDGPGVPEAQRRRIFERFVRLEADPGGTGLGLAICRSILRMHEGLIRGEAGPRKGGLRVICEIPLSSHGPELPLPEPVRHDGVD